MVARFLVDAAQLPGDPLAVDGCQLGTVEAAGAVAYSCNKHSPQVPPGGRDHVYFSASLGACPPISVCLSLYIFLYIYRAIRGTGEIWGWLFPGLLVCVYYGRGLIPSRPGGGKLPPENRIYFLMQRVGVYRGVPPPKKHAPGFLIPWPLPASRLRRWVDGLGLPLFRCQIRKALPGVRRRDPGPLHPSRPWGFILLLFYFRKCPVYTKVV